MNASEFIMAAVLELQTLLRDDRSARIAALAGLAVLSALSVVTVLVSRLRVRRRPRNVGPAGTDTLGDRQDLGDWGMAPDSAGQPASRGLTPPWPIDRVLPRRKIGRAHV